jgi:hypothetical protein
VAEDEVILGLWGKARVFFRHLFSVAPSAWQWSRLEPEATARQCLGGTYDDLRVTLSHPITTITTTITTTTPDRFAKKYQGPGNFDIQYTRLEEGKGTYPSRTAFFAPGLMVTSHHLPPGSDRHFSTHSPPDAGDARPSGLTIALPCLNDASASSGVPSSCPW